MAQVRGRVRRIWLHRGIVPAGPLAPTLSPVSALPLPATTVVTGAGGWLGTALLHRLTDPASVHHRPGSIVAVVTEPTERDRVEAVSEQVTGVVADVTQPASLERAFEAVGGTTDVIHTAGLIHPRRVAEFDLVNATGTRNVAELAHRSGVRRMVHVSSNSPFGTNPTPRDTFGHHEPYHPYLGYGRSKMAAELAVVEAVESGLDAVMVRPPWFYGPWQPARQTTFFKLVRLGRFPVPGDGTQRRSMVHVDNLVQGVVRAETAPDVAGAGYWIADARPYPLVEIVDTVRRALTDEGLACSGRIRHVPRLIPRAAELVDRTLQAAGRYHQQLHVLGELGHTIAVDVAAAERDLGYRPEIELYDGMRSSIRWCLDQGLDL